jgi:hypothetical protein
MTEFITYAFGAAIVAGIGGFTGWVVNLIVLRKARLEIQLLQKELEKLNSVIHTGLTTEEIERYTFRVKDPLRRIGIFPHLSFFVPALVTAAVVGGLTGVFFRGDSMQLVSAHSEVQNLQRQNDESAAFIGEIARCLEFQHSHQEKLLAEIENEVFESKHLPADLKTHIERTINFYRLEAEEAEIVLTRRILEYLKIEMSNQNRDSLIDALLKLQDRKDNQTPNKRDGVDRNS